MSVPLRHVLAQGPSLSGLGRTALSLARQRVGFGGGPRVSAPGPWHERTLAPRPAALVEDYIRHVGGDPSRYRGTLPPHFFPHWAFALAGKTLEGQPYPLAKALNGGCRMIMRGRLPADEPLEVRARLESVDDDGRRAILEQRIVTSTRSAEDVLDARLFVFVSLAKKGEKKGPKREKDRVPEGLTALARFDLAADAGLDFAKLTGDFNPVHWIPAYARKLGFRSTILHGFGTMARAFEGLAQTRLGGDVDALETFEVRFTRPLVLPARVGLFVDGADLFVGDNAGEPAYLRGSFETRDTGESR